MPHSRKSGHAHAIAPVLAGTAMVAAMGTLLGWTFEVPILRSILEGRKEMRPTTAAAMVLLGLAILANGRPLLARVLAAVSILGAADVNLPSALCCTITVLAILTAHLEFRGWRRVLDAALPAVGIFGFLQLLSVAYGVDRTFPVTSQLRMAVHEAAGWTLLSVAAMLLRPPGLLVSETLGGILARRLLPVTILLPAVVGFALTGGEHLALYGAPFVGALFASLTLLILTVILWLTCGALDRADQSRRAMEKEQLRLREQILQSDRLVSMGLLTAGIAHEIRNPLTYVVSNIRAIEQDAQALFKLEPSLHVGGEGEQVEELHRAIADLPEAIRDCRTGTQRIVEMLDNLKEFAHFGSGELESADLNALLESTLKLCASELKYKASVTRDFGALPLVRCRPQRIRQVFMNLIVNAADAIPERGEIAIFTREEEGCAVVRIRDTGGGIPPEQIRSIFEPFFTTKPVGRGTGLGLYVVSQIIESHGGRITVSSRPGCGTEFIIRLPIAGP